MTTKHYWTDCTDANLPAGAQVVADQPTPPKSIRRRGVRLVQVTGTDGQIADCFARLNSCASIVWRDRKYGASVVVPIDTSRHDQIKYDHACGYED